MGNTPDSLYEQKYFMTGELHFLRSEGDLQVVLANVMQSASALIRMINKHKLEHPENSASWVRPLEITISKLLSHLKRIIVALHTRQPICIPAVCISMECVAVVLTKTIIFLIYLRKDYKEDYVIGIIGQVLLVEG